MVYKVDEKLLPQIKEKWNNAHYITKDYRAFVAPFFSSSYSKKDTFYIELKITTDNFSKVKSVGQQYIDSQELSVKSKVEFYKINLISASRPYNTSVGVFIVAFLLIWGFHVLKIRLKQ